MITEVLLLIIFSNICYFIYLHVKILKRFKEHGIKHLPGIPIFGNCFKSLMNLKNDVEVITDIYNRFPDERYVGYFEGTTPVILIRDPEIAKLLFLENPDHFTAHQMLRVTKDVDKTFGNSLFMMTGNKWRNMRAILSPAFTPSKMRHLSSLMQQCSKNVVTYLKGKINDDVEMNDVMGRYSCDVVATSCFGLDLNSFKDRHNDLYTMGIGFQKMSVFQNLMLLFANTFPNIFKKLKIELFSTDIQDIVRKIIKETIEVRRKNKIVLSDMMQHLVDAPNDWTLDELFAQLFFFYPGAYIQMESILSLFIHEIVLNAEIQDKLYEEISQHKTKTCEDMHHSLKELPYLDAAYNETMRKWTTTIVLDRLCTKPYTMPPASPGAKPYMVQPGDLVYYPMNSVMLDPKYYPDPDKFNPDRFMGENKAKIKPYTFQPFGMGPRYCLGAKFISQQLKILMYNLILNFEFVKCAKTTKQIELEPSDLLLSPKNRTWVKILPRD